MTSTIRQVFSMQCAILGSHFRLLVFLLLFQLTACGDRKTQLERIMEKQQIRVLSRINSVSYFPGGDSHHAFEHGLVELFADYLGVEAKFSLAHMDEIYPMLLDEEGDVAAASLIREEATGLRFGSSYQTVNPVLVGNRGEKHNLPAKELLQQHGLTIPLGLGGILIKSIFPQQPTGIAINFDSKRDSEELLKDVAEGALAFTVTTSNELQRMQIFYPQLTDVLGIEDGTLNLAWAFKKSDDDSLFNRSEEFFQRLRSSGKLEQLLNQYYGYIQGFNYWNNLAFIERTGDRLPLFEHLFKQAGKKYAVDWRLLAAISYQESHWEEDASSFTGVRGLMMLTGDTANEMGVKDRTDPQQSIEGGARYFLKLKDKIAQRIVEPDRSWFALAAYNVGFGHLEDARILAESAGENPDQWHQVEPFLPRLRQKEWYEKTRHGFARGEEPVQFVRNIRRFYDILMWFDKQQDDLRYVKRRLDKMPSDLPTL